MTHRDPTVAAASGSADIFYEDVELGTELQVGSFRLVEADMVAFARQWDPLPIHVDHDAAAASPFGGLTAAGVHLLAVKQRLMHQVPIMQSVVCTMGFQDVRFLRPARPGDVLTLELRWLAKRPSSSRPGSGIVEMRVRLLTLESIVLEYRDTILMRRRHGRVPDPATGQSDNDPRPRSID